MYEERSLSADTGKHTRQALFTRYALRRLTPFRSSQDKAFFRIEQSFLLNMYDTPIRIMSSVCRLTKRLRLPPAAVRERGATPIRLSRIYPLSTAPTLSSLLIIFFTAFAESSSVNVASGERSVTLYATLFLPFSICSPV